MQHTKALWVKDLLCTSVQVGVRFLEHTFMVRFNSEACMLTSSAEPMAPPAQAISPSRCGKPCGSCQGTGSIHANGMLLIENLR